MDVNATKDFCRSLPGVNDTVFEHPTNIHTFYVHNRKFAYFKTSKPEQWRFSIRVSPDLFITLTDQPGIKPARYLHRFHWITIVKVDSMPTDYLQSLIQESYQKAVNGLSKKIQKALGHL